MASAERLVAISDHIVECEQCCHLFESPEDLRAAYNAINSDLETALLSEHEHPDDDQLAGFVDGTLDDDGWVTVSAHIESCADCKSEIREISLVKAQTEADLQQRHPRPEKVVNVLKRPGFRLASGIAAAVLVAAVFFGVNAYRTRLRSAGLESTVARLEQENGSLRRQAEQIKPARPAAIVLKDGNRQITVDENGELRGFLPASYERAIKEALTAGRITIPPPPKTNVGREGALLGMESQRERFEVIAPDATAVEDTRPLFEWQILAGAKSYTVLLKDLDTGEEIEGQPTSKTDWIPGQRLVRGHQYAWIVEAKVDGQVIRAPAPDKPFAAFRILRNDEAGEISTARKSWGDSHLLMGMMYAKAGLTREAKQEFKELVRENPASVTARRMLASIHGNDGRERDR